MHILFGMARGVHGSTALHMHGLTAKYYKMQPTLVKLNLLLNSCNHRSSFAEVLCFTKPLIEAPLTIPFIFLL